MRRRGDKIAHNQNLRVGVNKIDVTRRHDTTSRRQPLHGFTLIELLVVISIIALLLSIMMPALQRARAAGREVVCRSNLKSIGMLNMFYAEDNRNMIVPYWFTQRDYPHYYKITSYPHWQFVLKYLYENRTDWRADSSINVFACPGAVGVEYIVDEDYHPGYAKNVVIDWESEQADVAFYIGNNLLSVRQPSTVFLFMDASYMRVTPYESPPASWGYNWVDNRHNKGGNICFVDGSVSKRTPIPSSTHEDFKWSEWGGIAKNR